MFNVYDAVTLVLLAITATLASVAIWRGGRLLLAAATQRTAPKPRAYAWLHVVGIILFLNAMYLFSFFSPLAFLLSGVAFIACAVMYRAPSPKDLRRDGCIVSSIFGFAWLAYGAYEVHLNEWKETVTGAPIRVDFLILAPLFYLATAKTYAIFRLVTEAPRGPR